MHLPATPCLLFLAYILLLAGVIFVMGLIMRALVAATGTLVLAMGVHGVYDLVAGCRIGWDVRGFTRKPVPERA
jgi:membrane protease YdiL (CAAX protease family)